MCCFFATLMFFGPRLAFLIYWLFFPLRVMSALNTFIWPFLGLIFLPWLTLMYVLVFPINGFDWVWLGLALAADLAGYFGGGYHRQRVPGYSGP